MKKRRNRIILALMTLGLGGLGLAWLYDSWLGETQAASGPIAAIALPAEAAPPDITRVFEIDQDASEARFIIFEELRGEPKDVVGVTDQVAGQLALNLGNLSDARLGVIRINARTFVTDANRRNQAIRNRILQTDDYEYITFSPDGLIGLGGALQPGESRTFQAAGGLTIRDITRPIVFDVTLTAKDSESLSAEAVTRVSRNDFNLSVPNLSFIANVADEVRLEFSGEFRAIDTP